MEFSSITETLDKIQSKKISVEELNKIFIQRIKNNNELNAFIYFNEVIINDQSRKIENLKDNLRLKGIPLAIKDLFCTNQSL